MGRKICTTLFLLLPLCWMLALPAAAGGNFRLFSPAFPSGGEIPARFTCDGENVSPPLAWSAPPPGTRSLALIVSDPDAPDPAAPRITWTHWILYNLPPAIRALPEAVAPAALPPEARQGRNDWQRTGYGGPCPPVGTHRYFFRLYALDTPLPDLHMPDRRRLLQAMQGHILEVAEWMGRYRRR